MYYSDAEFHGGGGYATIFLGLFLVLFLFCLFVCLRWMLMFVHNVVKSNIEAVSYDIFFL